jgi:hypothetical protein
LLETHICCLLSLARNDAHESAVSGTSVCVRTRHGTSHATTSANAPATRAPATASFRHDERRSLASGRIHFGGRLCGATAPTFLGRRYDGSALWSSAGTAAATTICNATAATNANAVRYATAGKLLRWSNAHASPATTRSGRSASLLSSGTVHAAANVWTRHVSTATNVSRHAQHAAQYDARTGRNTVLSWTRWSNALSAVRL